MSCTGSHNCCLSMRLRYTTPNTLAQRMLVSSRLAVTCNWSLDISESTKRFALENFAPSLLARCEKERQDSRHKLWNSPRPHVSAMVSAYLVTRVSPAMAAQSAPPPRDRRAPGTCARTRVRCAGRLEAGFEVRTDGRTSFTCVYHAFLRPSCGWARRPHCAAPKAA